ncbi:hypothetical protein PLESTM_000273700 [Pleodorina starrii]|nr:hypothetical protein PLESTM_000273700 [Pleodorina starrii]
MSSTLGKDTGTVTQYKQPAFVSQRLTGAFCSQFEMNNLPSHKYETLPIKQGHLPGYAGHVPGGVGTIAQRKAQAAFHTVTLSARQVPKPQAPVTLGP